MDQSLAQRRGQGPAFRNVVVLVVVTMICPAVSGQNPPPPAQPQRLILPAAEAPAIRRVPPLGPRGIGADPVPVNRGAIIEMRGGFAPMRPAPAADNRPAEAALSTSEDLERLLERAIKVSEERPDLAPVLWQRIFDEGANVFARASVKNPVPLRRNYEIFRPFSNETYRALVAAGPEALRHYRLHSDGPARALMARHGSDREAALADIVQRYFLTTIGDDAAFELGCRLLERGDFISAHQLFNRLSVYPDSNLDADEVSVRRAVAQSRLGRAEAALQLVESLGKGFEGLQPLLMTEFQGHASAASLPVANSSGQPKSPAELAQAGPLETEWEFRPNWTLKGTKTAANNQAIMSGTVNGRAMIFVRQPGGNYVQTTLDDKDVPNLGYEQLAAAWRKAAWRPASNPVAVDGRLYLKSEARTVCCDAATGKVLWMGRPTRFPIDDWSRQMAQVAAHGVTVNFPTANFIAGPQPKTMTEIMLFSDRLHHELTVSGGRVFAVEGPLDTPATRKSANERANDRQVFGGQPPRQQSRHNELACYDAQSGRLLWSVGRSTGLPEEACLWSRPLVTEDLVLVATGQDNQLGLLALKAETGELVWKATLADLGRASPTIAIGLTVDEGSIYVASGAGNVFSVDRHGGALRWAISYPRTGSGNLDRRLGGDGTVVPRVQIVLEENFIALDGGTLILAASDSDHVMGFDVTDGSLRWDSPIPSAVTGGQLGYVVGLGDGRLYLASSRHVWSISTRGGRILWEQLLDGSCGRGMLTSDSLLIPREQTVVQLNPATGEVRKTNSVVTPDQEPVGNLLVDGEQLVIVSAARLLAVKPMIEGASEGPRDAEKKPSPGEQP